MLNDAERIALQGHWDNFRKGLILFVVAIILIFVGYKWQPLIQIPGLITLTIALFFSLRAWLGILKYRIKPAFKINK